MQTWLRLSLVYFSGPFRINRPPVRFRLRSIKNNKKVKQRTNGKQFSAECFSGKVTSGCREKGKQALCDNFQCECRLDVRFCEFVPRTLKPFEFLAHSQATGWQSFTTKECVQLKISGPEIAKRWKQTNVSSSDFQQINLSRMASRFFTIGSLLLLLATVANAQLSFHNDPSQNSFQIRTPGFQQSFTRYFNGQQGSLFAAQQQNPQSQPQYAVSDEIYEPI